MFCKYCGNLIDDDAFFCQRCGKKIVSENTETLKSAEMLKECERENVQNTQTKQNLETPITNDNVSPKSRTTALLLSIFFGFFGFHLFYVIKLGLGAIKVLTSIVAVLFFFVGLHNNVDFLICFSIFFVPIIIWELIDICIILFGKLKDLDGRIVSDWRGGFLKGHNIFIAIIGTCIVCAIFFSNPYNRLVYFGSADDKFNAAKKMLAVNSSYDKENQIKNDETNLLKHIKGKVIVSFLEKSANEGNAEAIFELGNIYAKTSYRSFDDIGEDKTKAIEYYEAAAEKGFLDAYCALGDMYASYDLKKAIEYYQQAGTKGLYKIAYNYYFKNDFVSAASYFLEIAERGNIGAYKDAGDCYKKAGDKNHIYYQNAVFCYQTCLDIGYKNAYVQFGILYFYGYGVVRNYKQALNLFLDYVDMFGAKYNKEDSDENDNSQNLTDMKKALLEMDKSINESIKLLFQTPEEKDLITAYEFLGFMYENGLGTPVKKAEAQKYYKLAANLGSEDAKEALQRF